MTKKVLISALIIFLVFFIWLLIYRSASISHPPLRAPMEESSITLCDLNQDGRCDLTDLQLLQGSIGKCMQDFKTPADFQADIDGDRCITIIDQKILFPRISEK